MLYFAPVIPTDEQNVELSELTSLVKLLEESRPGMLAMIERRTDDRIRSRRSAEDIYQDACVKAQARWHGFHGNGISERTWLYRIVLDCLGDDRDYHLRIKRDSRTEEGYPDSSSLQLVGGLNDHNPGPRTEAQLREEAERRREHVARVLSLLNQSQREILCMTFYDELSYREIAEILEVTEETARQRKCRSLIEFRDQWKQLFGSTGTES